jgi:hypothetical protein
LYIYALFLDEIVDNIAVDLVKEEWYNKYQFSKAKYEMASTLT